LAAAWTTVWLPQALANTISFTGNLRTDATFLSCGSGCTLGPSDADGDFAQWAAAVRDFHVGTASTMQGITFSYGGGTDGLGTVVAQGGFEPYLSLFDSSGDFLASTFLGTTCPPGAQTNTTSHQCFDVLLDGGTLVTGDYQIALSAYENLSLAENLGAGTLTDGFTGLGNLAAGEDLHYAFDVILTPQGGAVPEPSPAWLYLGALITACVHARKQKGRSHDEKIR
jgi:hypothetical protein